MPTHKGEVDVELYRLAIEQTKDYAVFLLDTAGHIITWNVGAHRIKGYAPEEIIGRHFSIFYPHEALESGWPAHELKVAASEGRFEDEGWRVRKDGSHFWAHVVITALRDDNGKLLGYSKITADVTNRRFQEEALRQGEERFRLLVEGVADYAIFMLDPEGIVTSWNTGAERINGYRRDEILGKHFSRFFPQDELDAGKPWEELATARRTGRAEDEGWRVRKNGERFWARAVVTTLYDSHGRLRGFAKVTQDLTQRRHIENLEKAARNVNEFIAVLAHELRNPLAPIRNALQVMARAPAGHQAHEAMRQTIDRQSAQLVRIVDDMLDISRISHGSLPIERRPVDMADVVRRALETATPAIEAARHTVTVDLPAERLLVEGDVHRLTQLLTNILHNSARYTPDGGLIAVSARAEATQAMVRVSDNGRGIEPELIDRMFDMFVRGREPVELVEGGLGVGLALARRIAEAHGGSLEAHSEGKNQGSEFVLRIPLSDSPAVSRDAQAVSQADANTIVPRRVLVVDDNVDAATTLGQLLKSLGHEALVVYDGMQALAMAVDFRPDVVLLDIGMPGLDGYEVARRLRALRNHAPLRIVAVTGWGDEADRRKSQEAGFDVHLVKPVDANELARVVGQRTGATLH
jgi:PAS domain S-box-containing protein